MNEHEVWIESADGQRRPVAATCSVGRSNSNDLVIDDGHVSRRHALIHKQDSAEYWVIDLGSGNGTYLNGRRVTMPTRLADGDSVAFGRNAFTFRQTTRRAAPRASTSPVSEQTIIQFTSQECWLLVADIKGSSALAQRVETTQLAVMIGRWTAACKEIVESSHGAINKYLGDGFLAFWPYSNDLTAISDALQKLMALQRAADSPAFRLALHKGIVTIGGAASTGEDSLSGPDVIRVFRMEKLASSLKRDLLVSEEVRSVHGLGFTYVDEGPHELPGFEGKPRRYYSLA